MDGFGDDPFAGDGNDMAAGGDDPFANDLGAYGADVGGDDLGAYGAGALGDDLGGLGGDAGAALGGGDMNFGGDDFSMPASNNADLGADLGAPTSSKKQEWEEQHARDLAAKKNDCEAAKRKLQEAGAAALSTYLQERQNELAKIKQQNRADEDANSADMNHTMAHGSMWEQVTKMVNLKKNEEDTGPSIERMRKLMFTLIEDAAASA